MQQKHNPVTYRKMLTKLLNRLMGLFISEQNEKADMDTKVKSLTINLASITFTLVVLSEGVWSLAVERVELAIPFLFLSFLLALSHLFLRKFNEDLHQNYLLFILWLTCSFFVLFGGNVGIGATWTFLFPFFATALQGRRNGLRWSLLLFLVMLLHLSLIQNSQAFFQNYSSAQGVYLLAIYAVATLIAFAFQFIRSEVLLEKEGLLLDSQNRNRAQEDLLSRLSHQIRTPLSNITGVLDMLTNTDLDPQQKEYISTIHASANNLVGVVNHLVMASHSDASEDKDITSFNLYNTLNNVLRLFPYEKFKLRFNLLLAPDIPGQLTGNSVKIKQILLNLINSIAAQNKAEQKQITLEVRNRDLMPGKTELTFSLTSDFVFQSPDDRHSGEGFFNNQDLARLNAGRIIHFLDLGLTQKMIEVDGHNLSIIPYPNRTVFEFGAGFSTHTGPFSAPTSKTNTQNSNSFKRKVELKDASILLVEDNFSNQQIMNLYIKNDVKKVETASNGKEALEKFGMARFDLILMDVQMPIMDGFKATQKIRELEKSTNTHVPIIAVTANAFPEDKERCLASGMDDYISKPFQPDELLDKIRQHLNG